MGKKIGRRLKPDERQEVCDKVARSKLPLRDACKRYGISPSSFYKWRKTAPAKNVTNTKQSYTLTEAIDALATLEKLGAANFKIEMRVSK